VISSPPLQIVVLIDGLGWQILEGREFLSDLLPYRMPLRTVLGYSSGAIPTILTGRPPAEHGHWNLVYRDPEGSPFRWLRHFQFVPNVVLDHRVTRKLLKEVGRRVLGLGPLFECCVSLRVLSQFNWVEKRNIYERGAIAARPSIFDQLAEAGVPYRAYSYHQWTDAEILEKATHDVRRREAAFFFVYLSELDRYLHAHVTADALVARQLAWYADGLRDLFRAARRVEAKARFTVVSDHGMTPVERHYDMVGRIESLGLTMPVDYLAVYDSTMARFWFAHERARREIVECLAGVTCGCIVSDEELARLGILFPDRRYGELVFLLEPGWLFSRSGFNGHGWKPAGMHGYHPDDRHSDAIYLASHRPPADLHSIADVYQCVERFATDDLNLAAS
jgi:Type I phosphodiesterase / nucleotide pyrophosphatase